MRRFALPVLAVNLIASAALAADHPAGWLDPNASDSVDTPSSTVPGCVNDWSTLGPLGDTCEGKVEAQRWEERRSAVQSAADVVVLASRAPDRANEGQVINALVTLAAAADAARAAYHAPPRGMDQIEPFFLRARVMSENWKLPIPNQYGDVFRSLSAALQKLGALKSEKAGVYSRAAIMATYLGERVTYSIQDAVRAVNLATLQAHTAARQAEFAAKAGKPVANPGAAIAAAGPDHPEIAQAQTTQLNRQLAAHPDQGSYTSRAGRELAALPRRLLEAIIVPAVLILLGRFVLGFFGVRVSSGTVLKLIILLPASWLVVALVNVFAGGGFDKSWWLFGLWLLLFGVLMAGFNRLLPASWREGWEARFGGVSDPYRSRAGTHGTARFGTAAEAVAGNHLAPAAPVDTFGLGWLPTAPKGVQDARFRQDGHVLTCAPTGAGKGIGAVIPNLLEYPGSAFVFDFKGENYAVTARARREAGQAVYLIDPFGITGAERHAMNWLDALNPDDPDVVALAGSLAEMLIVSTGRESDPHWNEAAKELLRGLLIYVAGLEGARRSMAEVRRIVTLPEDSMIDVFADMMADAARGQRIVARAAATQMNRPERERGSVLSTLVRHTAWLDDPRLEAAFVRSDFDLHDLKRRPMTVYIALPPDRLRACIGFLRGFLGLALNAMTAVPGKPAARVAFFLDEFGQLGRMDSIADNITILRGYGVQFWLFVQDLSQLKAVYPRWQSFMANTTQQFFGTSDFDTAKYISDTLGQYTIQFETGSSSRQAGRLGASVSQGQHLQGRALLTPDEVLRLGPEKPIVMPAGEAPYLLERINYLIDSPYAGRFDENPMHVREAV